MALSVPRLVPVLENELQLLSDIAEATLEPM